MQVQELSINQLIEVSVNDEDSLYQYLPSRIEEITEDYIYISAPMYKGEILPLRVGQEIKINFIKKDHSYMFNTLIQDRQLTPIALLKLRKAEQITEVQRRKWVRIPTSVGICFRDENEQLEVIEGMSIDISGGGVLFSTPYPVEKDQVLELEIKLPEREAIFCKGKVLRIIKDNNKVNKNYQVVVEYYDITEGQRDRIVAYLFEKQREWLRKGLLR